MRTARLTPDWMLRGWSDMPFTLIRWGYGDIRTLTLDAYYVLSSCDGKTNFDSFAFLPKHRYLLDTFLAEGIVTEEDVGIGIMSRQRYHKATNPFINGIEWNITGYCNLNCRHCYMESPSGKYGHLEFQDIERLIDQFADANVMEVSLTGGEPFVRKDLITIIERLVEHGIWLGQIYSNGLLIKQFHLDRIRELGLLPAFQISFDGVGGHDFMRGVKNIEKPTIEAIRFISNAGFPVVVSTSIDRRNVGSLLATYELMKELGVVSWRVSTPEKTGNWRNQDTDMSLDETFSACEPIVHKWAEDGKPFHIQLAGFFKAGADTDIALIEEAFNFTPDSYDCITCREQANVLPNGTLVPCPGYVDTSIEATMPNLIYGPSFSEAWASAKLRYFADLTLKDVLKVNPSCSACSNLSECGIGCRASALASTGDIMAKDEISCQIFQGGYRQRMRDAAKIYSKN